MISSKICLFSPIRFYLGTLPGIIGQRCLSAEVTLLWGCAPAAARSHYKWRVCLRMKYSKNVEPIVSQCPELALNFQLKSKVSESCSVASDSLWPHELYSPWNSPGQNTGVGGLSLLQGIFPVQGLNPDLLFCRQIFYHLSHYGSPVK